MLSLPRRRPPSVGFVRRLPTHRPPRRRRRRRRRPWRRCVFAQCVWTLWGARRDTISRPPSPRASRWCVSAQQRRAVLLPFGCTRRCSASESPALVSRQENEPHNRVGVHATRVLNSQRQLLGYLGDAVAKRWAPLLFGEHAILKARHAHVTGCELE